MLDFALLKFLLKTAMVGVKGGKSAFHAKENLLKTEEKIGL